MKKDYWYCEHLPKDNPDSNYHLIYHRIINRLTAVTIFVLLGFLCVEVVDSWFAFVIPVVAAFFLLGGGACVLFVLYLLCRFVINCWEFLNGY